MLINDLNKVTFVVEQDGDFTRFVFTDPLTTLEIGELRIKDEKGMAFIRAMLDLYREVRGPFGEFDENFKARAILVDKTTGAIEFNNE